LSVLLQFADSDYPFGIFKRVVHTTFAMYVFITCTQYAINKKLDTRYTSQQS